MSIGGDSTQYQIFMRKIGYSVGLEHTMDRVSDLCDLYINEGQINLSLWQDLVHNKWGLKRDNIGDFFSALGLIRRSRTKVDALSGLDMCAIARTIDSERVALKSALLLLIIEHDGEIFLNALVSGFAEEEFARRLKSLIDYKRGVLFGMYRAPEIQAQLAKVVGIERQASNVGGAGKAQGLSEQRRKAPLSKRTESLRGPGVPPVEISDDYLGKVLPTRRAWAISLGLYTPEGEAGTTASQLWEYLGQLGLVLKDGSIVLWPFSHEISRFRINPTQFEEKIIAYWDLVKVSLVAGGASIADKASDKDREFFVELCRAQLDQFRRLNIPKAMLRRELPLTVGYLTLGAAFHAAGRSVPPLPDLLAEEQRRLDSPLEIRTSRNSIGTILVRLK